MATKSLFIALLALPVFAAAQKTRITIINSHPAVRSYTHTRVLPAMGTHAYLTHRVYRSNGDAIGPFALHSRGIGSVHYYAPAYRATRIPAISYRVRPAIRPRAYISPRPVYIQRNSRSVKRGVLN
jgi:hypothetical protein